MPTFNALVRVVYQETWTVDAEDEQSAREKIDQLTDDVDTDDAGGEIANWEITSIKADTR